MLKTISSERPLCAVKSTGKRYYRNRSCAIVPGARSYFGFTSRVVEQATFYKPQKENARWVENLDSAKW